MQLDATVVEVLADEDEGFVTIHFDDQADHYLQLQYSEVDVDEFEEGYGTVSVEVNDQINSGYNCFSAVELTRQSFRIVFARDARLMRIGEVVAAFDLDDAAFDELRTALVRAFRAFPLFATV